MKINRLSQVLLLSLGVSAFAQASFPSNPLDTPKHPVVAEYQGVKVTDDYRWLENWDDPVVKQWSAAQNARTREYLDHLPSRSAITARLRELIGATPPSYYYLQFRTGMLFAMKDEPPRQQPMLVVMRSTDDPASARVIIDPNASSTKGVRSIDFYVPSSDGKYVAAAMSENGSEDSSAYIFDVAIGKQLSDVVPRVNFATAGGSIAWKADSSGFYYTRYPQGNERPPEDANFYQQVYLHKLGTDPKQDTYVIGKDFPRIAEIQLRTSEDGRWLLASVGNGDGGQFAHYVMDPGGLWTQVTHFEDGVVYAGFGSGDGGSDTWVYLLSRKNAPRGQILRLSLTKPDLAQARIIVPQSAGDGPDESARASIDYFVATSGRLFVVDVLGGPSRVRLFDNQGKPLAAPVVPPVSAIGQIVRLSGGDVLLNTSTHLQPPAWYRFEAATGKIARTALFQTSPVKYDDTEVVRDFATSRDGTRVPLSIIRRKGTALDGTHPVLLTGYGGFGISEQPYFLGSFARVWLDLGGVFVDTNLRGGSEYGEEWHTSGNLTHKQNVFDDFLACTQYLIDHKYTSPAHLAIIGGSNGGLLMGAAFTQRPDLFRAVVSSVGIYDMLRVELDPNGQFNTTEYGSVKDPEQFKALYAYSPYHHVKDRTAYPAILMLTGENDHRVNPMQSRKMIARLQAADSSGHPILLRTSSTAGHGFGTALDEAIEENADIFSFLFDQLGMEYAAEKK
ncbi:MAG TPA: prolyl oligopeptidase family serine peptidase [Candidatus Sulfotelmatobacter sp.]|nr:prolyl oligopeptidase family serine peptidase [Candidatus Sulfotelmatobacter sp.]